MPAATYPVDTIERKGALTLLPVAADLTIYQGTLVAVDASGRAVPAADTAGLRVIGRAEDTSINTNGGAGAASVPVKRGVFRFANSSTSPVLAADIGKDCYAEDNHTVAQTSAHKVKAGCVIDLEDGGVWVDTSQARRIPSADTITGAADLAALKVALLALLQGQGLVG